MDITWLMLQALASIITLPRDISFGIQYMQVLRLENIWNKKGWTIHQVFDRVVKEHPDKIAVRLEQKTWTFQELQDYSLRVANVFQRRGYVKGDAVALLMENHPRYIATWLGLSRIGVITALLNTGVKGDTLLQAVTTATKKPCKGFIVSINYAEVVMQLKEGEGEDKLPDDVELYIVADEEEVQTIEALVHLGLLKPVTDEPSSSPDEPSSSDLESTVITEERDTQTLQLEPSKLELEQRESIETIIKNLIKKLKGFVHLDPLLKPTKDDPSLLDPIKKSIVKSLNMSTKMVYVYTSGTEGYPKAATFDYFRFSLLAVAIHKALRISPKDVIYSPMPLYHVSGGLVGTGQMLLFGSTMIIKTKFSATSYFTDCNKYGATVGQYIGEMCSFIYSKDPAPTDKKHHVQMMFGNGMRASLWEDFQKRFNVPRIGEFYGSTEGNANMINIVNKVGAVGFIPWISRFMYPVDLIEYNPTTSKPIRGANGLCKRAKRKGILVGQIKKTIGLKFDGYENEEATKSKILRDVFKKGDAWFNTGDVLERDIFAYYYFVDRLGDTFRWKGENIATSQVEGIIVKYMGVKAEMVAVYGVVIEGQEGRAGMAAFALDDEELDKTKLLEVAKKHMIVPQIPVFLRITKDLPKTSTEKIKKAELKEQGWDPKEILGKQSTDKLYYYNKKTESYEPLTQTIHDKIVNKELTI